MTAVLAPLIESGVVATCGVIEFEVRWATRSSAQFDQVQADRDAAYEWLATHDEDWRRALDVQAALWRSGRIRAVGLPDLLVAAVAERERVSVLHYDANYELIAQVTGQPVQWVLPSRNGSLIRQDGTLRPVNEPRAANERARIRLALGAHDLARVSGRRGCTMAVAVTVREVDAAHTAVPCSRWTRHVAAMMFGHGELGGFG